MPRLRNATPSRPRSTTPRFEHDACGVGFVADAGGRSAARVLPLALAGLAALGHRGAFGADGESSDGAGRPAPARRPARSSLLTGPGWRGCAAGGCRWSFLPRGRDAGCEVPDARSARRSRPRACAGRARGGAVPTDAAALGSEAAALTAGRRPGDRRAAARRATGRPLADAAFERASSSPGVGSRPRPAVAAASTTSRSRRPRAGRSSTRASSPAAGSPSSTRTSPRRWPCRYALFHQRYATNTHADLARSPSRSARSPTTARSTPSAATASRSAADRRRRDAAGGRRRARARSRPARCSRRTAPIRTRSTRPSSCSCATGWDLGSALLALDARSVGAAARAASRTSRRSAAGPPGFVAPWDGPAAIVVRRRPAGRRDPRPQRAATGGLRGDPRPARRARVRGRRHSAATVGDGSPRAAGTGRDAARRPAARRDPRGRRGEGPSPPAPADPRCSAAGAPRPGAGRGRQHRDRPSPLRFLAGLDAEKARLDVKTMALEGHEPLWSHGRRHADARSRPRRPAGRRPPPPVVRPGHEPADRPGARAGRHGPAGRARARDRRCSAARRARRRRERSASNGRSSPISTGLAATAFGGPRRVDARRDVGPADAAAPDSRTALDRLADGGAWPPRERGVELLVLSRSRLRRPTGCRSRRSSRSARVHTALTDAGLRGRTDVVADAADILDVHALAMALAVGATAVVRGSRSSWPLETGRHARRRGARRRPTRSRTSLAAFEAGLRKTLARMGISTIASYIGGLLFETIELDDDRRRGRCFPARARRGPGRSGCRPRRAPAPARAAAAHGDAAALTGRRTGSRTRASRASGPTARPTSSRRGSPARSRRSRSPTSAGDRATTRRGARPIPRRRWRGPSAVVRDGLRVAAAVAAPSPSPMVEPARDDRPSVRRVGDVGRRAVARRPTRR